MCGWGGGVALAQVSHTCQLGSPLAGAGQQLAHVLLGLVLVLGVGQGITGDRVAGQRPIQRPRHGRGGRRRRHPDAGVARLTGQLPHSLHLGRGVGARLQPRPRA